jgi:hypothetical protein
MIASLLRMCRGVLLLLAAVAAGSTAQEFEGVVTMRELHAESAALSVALAGDPDSLTFLTLASIEDVARAEGAELETTELRYYISGARLRSAPLGLSGSEGEYLIIDFAAGLYRIVDPRQQLIVEWQGRTSEDTLTRANDDAAPPSIVPLSERRDINGYPCRAYRVTHASPVVEVSWLTSELADLRVTFSRLAALSEELGSGDDAARSIDRLLQIGFPIRTVSVDTASGTVSGAEIVTVERRALEPATFDPPPGYMTVTVER